MLVWVWWSSDLIQYETASCITVSFVTLLFKFSPNYPSFLPPGLLWAHQTCSRQLCLGGLLVRLCHPNVHSESKPCGLSVGKRELTVMVYDYWSISLMISSFPLLVPCGPYGHIPLHYNVKNHSGSSRFASSDGRGLYSARQNKGSFLQRPLWVSFCSYERYKNVTLKAGLVSFIWPQLIFHLDSLKLLYWGILQRNLYSFFV